MSAFSHLIILCCCILCFCCYGVSIIYCMYKYNNLFYFAKLASEKKNVLTRGLTESGTGVGKFLNISRVDRDTSLPWPDLRALALSGSSASVFGDSSGGVVDWTTSLGGQLGLEKGPWSLGLMQWLYRGTMISWSTTGTLKRDLWFGSSTVVL